jgi:hypothetical protein
MHERREYARSPAAAHLVRGERFELFVRQGLLRGRMHLARQLGGLLASDARRLLLRGRKEPRREVGVVASARDVQGDAEERRLDDLALFERPRELFSLKTRQP